MEFKQYPSYKNSSVEWLGDVPEHWESNRLKKYLIERNEKNSPIKTDNLLSVTMYQGVIPVSEKQGNGGNKPKENLENYKISYPNDIVLNSMNVIVGSVGLNKYTGLISPAYYALYNRNKNNNIKFFSYIFHNPFFQKGLFGLGNGIMYKESEDGKLNTIRLKIPMEKLNQVVLPCPSISEQNQIVAFLNTETIRIDNLISKQEKLIELLEEQRKSIISHAVTKGLNPNAPMKDSGVEWLGEVPEHWEVTRLKNIGKSIIGLTYSPNEICNPDDDSYLVLRSSNVQNGQLSFLDNVYVKSYVSEKLKIKKNDILICSRNGSRDLIGKNTIIKNPPKNSTFGAFMTVYRSEHADYVYWILNSYIFKAQAGSYLTTTVNQLTINNLNNMTVPFAPTSEQNEIVEFLSTENLKFNNLISKQKALIEKLKEYRASIISHAVTGKIDVREFGA